MALPHNRNLTYDMLGKGLSLLVWPILTDISIPPINKWLLKKIFLKVMPIYWTKDVVGSANFFATVYSKK